MIACATRRVGEDHNGSLSFKAWRRTSTNATNEATTATTIQNKTKPEIEWIGEKQGMMAAPNPMLPDAVMMGAKARR